MAVVDGLANVGGQLTALYPQKPIYDVAGYPRIAAADLVDKLKRQVRQQHIPLLLEFKVVSLLRNKEGAYDVVSEDGRKISGRYVIIAAGAGMITPRKLELPEAERYVGHGLEYVVTDIEAYRDQKVLVIGGGDTALDWANYLLAVAKQVTLIHRSDRFVGFEGSLRRLQESACTIFTDTKLTGVAGIDKLEKAQITNTKEGWTKELEIDRILGCIGFTPKLGFIKESGLEIAEGSIRADDKMRTSVENVYAVGDISNYPGRIKLISTGFRQRPSRYP